MPADDPAHRLRDHLFPEPVRGRQPQSPQRAVRDLAERAARDQSARLLPGADDRRSVPGDRAGQADDDGGAALPPIPACPAMAIENETAYAEQWHLGIERQLFSALLARARVRRQRAEAPHALLQPERDPTRSRHAGFAPAAAADRRASPTCCSAIRATARPTMRGTLKLQQRFTRRPAVPRELHLRQVARLRQLGGERRRRGRQRADDHEHGRVARPVRVRRAPSRGHQLRLRAALRHGPPLDERCRRPAAGRRRRLAAVGHHDVDDRPAVHASRCRPASTTAPRAGRIGSAPAGWTTRPSTCGSTRPTSWRRRRTPTATPGAASSTARVT